MNLPILNPATVSGTVASPPVGLLLPLVVCPVPDWLTRRSRDWIFSELWRAAVDSDPDLEELAVSFGPIIGLAAGRLKSCQMPSPLLLLIFPFIIQGVCSTNDGWGVNYSSSYICALKGSTVIINCTYKYPNGHQIKSVFWTNTTVKGEEPPDLFNDSEYSQRIQYLGDKHHNCTIRLTDVRQTDSHEYYFRFITDKNRWLGSPGVTLDITDLQLETSGKRVTEGQSVTLTCKSRCSLTNRFIWFKNTQPLSEKTDKNNELILQSVTRENAGNYSCAVQGHNLTSPHRYLNVIYTPNKPVISIKPDEIMEGDSVNLTCSSDANPPVHNYSWFKVNKTTSVGSGQTYIITNINSSHSEEFYCEAQNEVGSQRSAAVSVSVKV
nr:B-cell receptor CD22-like [Misgurnus anguillicaudatus]